MKPINELVFQILEERYQRKLELREGWGSLVGKATKSGVKGGAKGVATGTAKGAAKGVATGTAKGTAEGVAKAEGKSIVRAGESAASKEGKAIVKTKPTEAKIGEKPQGGKPEPKKIGKEEKINPKEKGKGTSTGPSGGPTVGEAEEEATQGSNWKKRAWEKVKQKGLKFGEDVMSGEAGERNVDVRGFKASGQAQSADVGLRKSSLGQFATISHL